MQAILMAGGKGTRLRPFTHILPKPLVPVGEKSILEMVLRQLLHAGFRKVTIVVGHKAELIMAVIGNGCSYGLDIDYYHEDKPLGTIGALAYLNGLEDNFLVMNGDICTNLNFRELYQTHIRSGAAATIGAYARHEKIELGVLTINDTNDRIVSFQEKPEFDFLVSMGVNAFNRSIVELIPKGEYFGFDGLMHKMIAENLDIRPYLFKGLWYDIGRLDDYEKMVQEYKVNPSCFESENAG